MDKITIVGCGPGATGLMTQAATEAIETADYIVGSRRLLEMAGNTDAVTLNSGANTEAAIEFIEKNRGKGKVAVLVSGDPGIFSVAKLVVKKFGIEQCRIIPGISSIQAAFAALGQSWNDAMIISAHSKDPEKVTEPDDTITKIAVLLGTKRSQDWVVGFANKLKGDWVLYLCENLSLENEKVRKLTVDQFDKVETESMAIAVLVRKEHIN